MNSGEASSNSTQIGDLPRIDCPKCKIKVIKCKTQKKGDVYYKCPNHFPNNSGCPYYWYEERYLQYLRSNHPELVIAAKDSSLAGTVAEEVNAGLQLEICQLKLQMAELKCQVGEVSRKVMEAKEEIKEEIAKANKAAVPSFSCQIV